MIEYNGKKYRTVDGNPNVADSPCDLCELPICIIGVEDCENEYGSDTYFKEIKS